MRDVKVIERPQTGSLKPSAVGHRNAYMLNVCCVCCNSAEMES
jgi:hypothetical protein